MGITKRVCFALSFLAVACAWGQWTEPVLVDSNLDTLGINTLTKEWCPFISADGNYFYFTREHTNNDLYVCHREGEGWSEPLKLPFCQEPIDERNPSVNATNDTLYFISLGSGGWDIFWCFRTGLEDTSWSQPERMPEPINSGGIDFSVWATPDNQRLLFSSARAGGMGGEDIYECRRDPTTETGWSLPLLLPGQLDSWTTESYPSMSSDTTEIFFHRTGFSGLYVACLMDNAWNAGELLPAIINRVIQQFPSETTPCISPDGGRLYFFSRWNGDSLATAGDIWYSDRPTAVRNTGPPHTNGRSSIRVYPNPSSGRFTLESISPLRQLTVFNLLGQTIADISLPPQTRQLDFSLSNQLISLPVGVYWLRAGGQLGTYVIPVHINH